jgi:hypothetical protein
MPRQTSSPNLLTKEQWIEMSKDSAIKLRISDDAYSMAYPAVRSHFMGIENIDWDAAVIALHVVYGWMPTIPRLSKIMRWDDKQKLRLISCLNDARNGKEQDALDLHTLKGFCNNSIVGGSKLLHFLNPARFPIWDSRVAKVFLQKPNTQSKKTNSIETWNTYQKNLADWQAAPEIQARCEELRQLGVFLEGVTNLRLIELVMFHTTTSKRR